MVSNPSWFAGSISTEGSSLLQSSGRGWSQTKFRDPPAKGRVFASTPPLEANRVLRALAMKKGCSLPRVREGAAVDMSFLDISCAHPHVAMTLCTELSEEHPEHHKDRVGRWLRHLYGVREASHNSELKVEETCVAGDGQRGLYHRALSRLHTACRSCTTV